MNSSSKARAPIKTLAREKLVYDFYEYPIRRSIVKLHCGGKPLKSSPAIDRLDELRSGAN
jgi:hypothetical protein